MFASFRTMYVAAACLSLAGILLACAPTSAAVPGQPKSTEISMTDTPSESVTISSPSATTPATASESAQPTPAPSRSMRLTPSNTRLPERAPITTPPPITGEVPGVILNGILADLARRLGITQADIEVVRAESVVWSDGALGCPEPGINYTQAQVDGYWVVLKYDSQCFDYRATDSGYFRLCPNPELLPSGTPASSGTTKLVSGS